MNSRKFVSPTNFARTVLAFALMSICLASTVWAQTVAGSISAMSGNVTIQRAGTTIPAAYGAKVDVGDRLVTAPAGSVTVTLSDGSQIELTESSTLTIDENTLNPNGTRASTKLSLLNGLVRSLVNTTPGTPPNYEVHTPNAVASARGTSYEVDHETGVHDEHFEGCTEFSHVAVYKGVVEVSNPLNSTAPAVQVKEGQKVTVPCGAAPILGTASLLSEGALGVLGLLGAGGIAVAVIGATGGFGSGGHPVSPAQ